MVKSKVRQAGLTLGPKARSLVGEQLVDAIVLRWKPRNQRPVADEGTEEERRFQVE